MQEFRKMRREKQCMDVSETTQILQNATSGVLSVIGDEGYPYGVPMSFVYADGRLIFHSALNGHKIDAITKCNKCCFTVIAQDDVHGAQYSTYYKSVIAFGRVKIIDDTDMVRSLALQLGEKYNPGHINAAKAEIDGAIKRMKILVMEIEHVTGKKSMHLL